MPTYLIHTDNSYADTGGATLERFDGSRHALLCHLNGMTSADEEFEDEQGVLKPAESWTESELEDLFTNANGDGQNGITVFEETEPGTFERILG